MLYILITVERNNEFYKKLKNDERLNIKLLQNDKNYENPLHLYYQRFVQLYIFYNKFLKIEYKILFVAKK